MKYNPDKVDDLVLALLYLNSHAEHGFRRAWKSHNWDALDRLYEKGLISDPKTKSKSVVLSEECEDRAKRLLDALCCSEQ